LFATVDRFNGKPRRFEDLKIDTDQVEQDILEPVATIADLEKPIARQLEDVESASSDSAPIAGGLVLLLAACVIGFWVYLGIQGSGEELSLQSLLSRLRLIADHPLAPFAAVPAIVAGSLLFAPIIGMIALCALLFDPWAASLIALAGTLCATVVNHWVGSHFHTALMRRIPDKVTDRISTIASSSDVWTLAGLRLIPIAPFTVVNLVVGASGIRLRPFIIGTLISMTPGIVLICLSVDRARAALAGEPVFDPWILAGIAGAGIATIALRVWKNKRSQRSRAE
jgi:phospholipase D1/2